MVLLERGSQVEDARLLSMMGELFAGYRMAVSLQAPRDVALRVLPEPSEEVQAEVRGRRAGFSIAIRDMLALSEGLGLEFGW